VRTGVETELTPLKTLHLFVHIKYISFADNMNQKISSPNSADVSSCPNKVKQLSFLK